MFGLLAIVVSIVLTMGVSKNTKQTVTIHLPYMLTNSASPAFKYYLNGVKDLEVIRFLHDPLNEDEYMNFFAEKPLSLNWVDASVVSHVDNGTLIEFHALVDEDTLAISTEWTPQFLFSAYIDIDITDKEYQDLLSFSSENNRFLTVEKEYSNGRKKNTIYNNLLFHTYDNPWTGETVSKEYGVKNNLPQVLSICRKDYLDTIEQSKKANNSAYTELMQISNAQIGNKKEIDEKVSAVVKWVDSNIMHDEEITPCILEGINNRKGTCLTKSYMIKEMLEGLGIENKIEYGWNGEDYHATNSYLGENQQWLLLQDIENFIRFDKRIEFE